MKIKVYLLLCPILTDVYECVAGHGVPRKRQLPSGPMGEAAGEGISTVTNQARLKLKHRTDT